jgi:hypothetical protein
MVNMVDRGSNAVRPLSLLARTDSWYAPACPGQQVPSTRLPSPPEPVIMILVMKPNGATHPERLHDHDHDHVRAAAGPLSGQGG